MFRGEYKSVKRVNLEQIAESKKPAITRFTYLTLANSHSDNIVLNSGHTEKLIGLTEKHSLLAGSEIYKVKKDEKAEESLLFSIVTARRLASRLENIPNQTEREQSKVVLLGALDEEVGQRDLVSSFQEIMKAKESGFSEESVNTLLFELYASYRQCVATKEFLGYLYPLP